MMREGIDRAIELESRPVFLEGLSARLSQLGTACTADDTEIILTEIKKRYKAILGKSCPRTVQEWIKSNNIPGTANRQNHYDLCYALEMDYQQTEIFFQKHYLTLPFNVKDKVDAVFMYALYHKKPYSVVIRLLTESKGFVSQENAHTSTLQIISTIFSIDNDDKFLRYLSEHCYDNEQQFQLARTIINNEIDMLKEKLLADSSVDVISPDRLNSLTIDALLGYKYQSRDKGEADRKLPKRYTETLMLLKFCNYYRDAENEDRKHSHETDKYEVNDRLMDFYDKLNGTLISCGFAQLYVRHPFDCLLLYCANSYDPILTLHLLNERN